MRIRRWLALAVLAALCAADAAPQAAMIEKPLEIRVVVDRADTQARELVAKAPVYILGAKGSILASAKTDDRGRALLVYVPSDEAPSMVLVEDKDSYISGMRFVAGLSEYYIQVTPWVVR